MKTLGSNAIDIAKSAMHKNATATNNASKGLLQSAENGMELVVGRSVRWLNAGDKVLNNSDTNKFFKGLVETQVFQARVQVVGGGWNQLSFNMGGINIQNSDYKEQIIQQAC